MGKQRKVITVVWFSFEEESLCSLFSLESGIHFGQENISKQDVQGFLTHHGPTALPILVVL